VINVLWKTSLEDGKKSLMLTGIEHYKCQDGNHEILKTLRKEVLDAYGAFTVGETAMVNIEEAKLLSGEARRELDMVFYFDHLEVDRRFARFVPKKFRAGELLKRLDKWQRGLEWNALYLENHDQSRIVSHYGDDRGAGEKDGFWERSAKLLAVLEFTLRGTPFVYQGQEIGMTNFDFTGIEEVKDIETHNLNRLMKKFFFPAWLRWRWLRLSSRDNARTPFQWDSGPGAGFSSGAPWLGVNRNYRVLNYAAQRDDPASVLSFYKQMIRFRAGNYVLKYGEFHPLCARGPVIAYERRFAVSAEAIAAGDAADMANPAAQTTAAPPADVRAESFVVLLNFSGKRAKLPAGYAGRPLAGKVAVSNTGRADPPDKTLEPWEAAVIQMSGGSYYSSIRTN
jgi:oligo-1,6-glucosidase